jgi:NitT/TauT family transport system substrate-binding protein
MKRRDFLKGMTGASVGLLSAAAGRSAVAAPTALRLASTTGAIGLITQVIARESLAKQHDLTLDVRVLTPDAAEKILLLQQVDAGGFPVISAASMDLKGQDIVIFGPFLYMHSFVLVWADSPYRTLADLKGKKISLLDKISGAYRGMQVLAAWQGFDLERDFHLITAPPPAIIAFLKRKDVDAIVIHEPLTSILLAEGKFRVLLGMNDEWKKRMKTDWLFQGLAAHRSWLERNSGAARRLLDLVLDGCRRIRAEPDLVAAEAAFLGLKSPAAIDLAKKRMPQIFPTEWNATVVGNVLDVVREAVRIKQIPEMPSNNFVSELSG